MSVYGIGLPRCGGQSLTEALTVLLGDCVHSPGKQPIRGSAATEVFRHPQCILREDPEAKFIINVRDAESWLASCKRVVHRSREWNHPIWKYPLRDFHAYRQDYLLARSFLRHAPILVHDLIKEPRWEPLCSFLDLPIPDVPFPNADRVGRRQASA